MAAAPTPARFFLASDVGGTFTDTVLVDAETGRSWSAKVPSRNRRQDESVAEGIQAVLLRYEAALQRGDVAGVTRADLVVPLHHGTTVPTNALLERRIARVLFVTNDGFEDLLVIRRQDRPDLYDLKQVRPTPLVADGDRMGLPLRRGPKGEDWAPPDADLEAALERIAARVQEAGIEAIAVGLLHADLHPEDEAMVATWLRHRFPDRTVTASHEVWPEMREVERFETLVVNAALVPVVTPYLDRLEAAVQKALRGATLAGLRVIDSAGTLRPVAAAARFPASLLLSGPAGGVQAGAALAAHLDRPSVVTFDVGGTSTDIALTQDGKAARTTESRIGGFACRFPSVDLHTLGAGGGSILWRDPGGLLQVGPQSQGAYPGPACYGRGGETPTLTDALLLAGRIPEGLVFGGRTRPDRKAAYRALERLAANLRQPLQATVLGAIRIAVEAIAGGVHVVTTQRGHDARAAALLAFGGAGPLVACELAAAIGMREVLVPWDAGTFSARGLAAAPVVDRQAKGLDLRLSRGGSEPPLAVHWDALVARLPEGIATGRAAMRYVGQSHELEVAVHRDADAAVLLQTFEAAHERRFGHMHAGRPVEVVRLVVEHMVDHPDPGWSVQMEGDAERPDRLVDETPLWLPDPAATGGFVEAPAQVVWRSDLAPGSRLRGPLVVPDATATTYVPPGWWLGVEPDTRVLVLTQEGSA